MKFFYFYDDVLTEGRVMGNEKFVWVAQNMGNWLFDELHMSPEKIKGLPNMDQFNTYVRTTIKKSPTTNDLVENLWLMETFLNRLDPKESAIFIKKVLEKFPKIKSKLLRYGKPEITSPGRRGRPMGSKNKPKIDDFNIMKTPKVVEPSPEVAPEITPEVPTPPAKRGRPKMYNDELSAMERSKYRREGPAMIQSLEAKAESLDNEVTFIVQRIKKIMNDIEKRKKFFGIQ